MKIRRDIFAGRQLLPILLTVLLAPSLIGAAEAGRELVPAQITAEPQTFRGETNQAGAFTWWFPKGADAYVLPVGGGALVEATNAVSMRWLKAKSPWDLTKLPVVGVRYGEKTLVVIVPWPHYAELVADKRVGVRFHFPQGRRDSTPTEIVALWRGPDPLEPALAFRAWRESAKETGAIPRPRPLSEKISKLPAAGRLPGAPHIYIWGPALFSRHDVDRDKWTVFSRRLRNSTPESFESRMVRLFPAAVRQSLNKMAESDWADMGAATEIALAIDQALTEPALLKLPPETPAAEVAERNRAAFAEVMGALAHPPETWGDGWSRPMLEALREEGIDRGILLLSDFYGRSPRPELVAKATELGFLTGPYDSYHSVHDPAAPEQETWETAQFDRAAFESGRVLKADGKGHPGFNGKGFHFSPKAAWPYVTNRVGPALAQSPFTAWFVDCDATAECFDDYNPAHPATRLEDISIRRERLSWLEADRKLVVGSEEGSVLFADVIHFGHGIQTPYIGHLSPSFKDPGSASFLGRHWPADSPATYFKPISVPPEVASPYFDPRMRIPLYQAALGDEVVVSHHWNFDSFKFLEAAPQRELLELLYMVPPLYHLNRETWPQRREQIGRHFAYWSPLHRKLATAPLVRFEWLTEDRSVQRTTFKSPEGEVTMTVNFNETEAGGLPGWSAKVAGAISAAQTSYTVKTW